MTIIIFLIVLAVLVFVHELGHFIAAKACGIRVDAFAIGFGPRLFSRKVGEVLYSINLVPFGGYVKIFGENPDDENTNGPDRVRSFVHKAKWQQIFVLFSGILFNFIFAYFLIIIAFTSGVLASPDSYPEYTANMSNPHITITYVNPSSPAEKAGLRAGDILSANSMDEIRDTIDRSAGKTFPLKYTRSGVDSEAILTAEKGIVSDRYTVGISMDNVSTLKLPLHKSFIESFRLTLHIISTTFVGIYDLISGIFHGTAELSSVTGPVGIAGLVGDAAKLGFTYLMMFTAIISINLGVLNLIPFPALDGGRIFFVMIEAVIRRPIKPAIANTVNAVGFGLLILLMVVVTYRDIAKLFVK